jgi:hypothetical protein
MFYSPDNQKVKVNGVFQIWCKYTKNPQYEIVKHSQEKVKIYSLSNGKVNRNKNMIGKCDAYLPSTCFGKENMKIYNSFEELPGQKGYGIVFKGEKPNLESIDWSSVAFLSTNSAYNLRTSLILSQILIKL